MIQYNTIITMNSINIYENGKKLITTFNYEKENNNLKEKEFEHFGIIGLKNINNNEFIIFIKKNELIGEINKEIYYKIKEIKIIFNKITNIIEANYLKKILKNIFKISDFFYKNSYSKLNDEFIFNSNLINEDIINKYPLLIKGIMFGSIETFEFGTNKISLICKRSNFGMGTRLHSRGLVKPYFYPTNNTQLTLYIETKEKIYSNIQLRGSIPLFWTQNLSYKYTPPFNLTYHNIINNEKNINEISIDIKNILIENEKKYKNKFILKNSINLHSLSNYKTNKINETFFKDYIEYLKEKYKANILIVNLLKSKGIERNLFIAYDSLLRKLKLNHLNFDISLNKFFELNGFGKELKNINKKITKGLSGFLIPKFKFNDFSIFDKTTNKNIKLQNNIIRTNCIDSSDRTTHFQLKIIEKVLINLRFNNNKIIISDKLINNFYLNASKKLSKQYTGTESLLFPFTKNPIDFFYDGIKSLQRYFINRFFDGEKNDAYKIFTGEINSLKFKKHNVFNWFFLFYFISILPFIFLRFDLVKEYHFLKVFILLIFLFLFLIGFQFNEGSYF